MTEHEWMKYKAKLERLWRAGDEGAGRELHDIIVEETGLLHQKPSASRTSAERHHLKIMKDLFCDGPQDTFNKADWEHITSGQVQPFYTQSLYADEREDAFP